VILWLDSFVQWNVSVKTVLYIFYLSD